MGSTQTKIIYVVMDNNKIITQTSSKYKAESIYNTSKTSNNSKLLAYTSMNKPITVLLPLSS